MTHERATFRELFDEQDREDLVNALLAQIGPLTSRIARLKAAPRVTDAVAGLEKREQRLERLENLLDRIVNESI